MGKIKQHRRRCTDCKRVFANAGARARHWKAQHWVPPPPPKPPEEEEMITYTDLVNRTGWRIKLTKTQQRNPGNDVLMLAATLAILEEIRAVRKHIGAII